MNRVVVTNFLAGGIAVLAGTLAQAQERVRLDLADARVDTRMIVEQLDKAIGYGATRSLAQPGAARVSLMLPLEFTFGSSRLTNGAAKSLDKVVGALNDPKLRGRRFVVEGHTDAVGTDENNIRLSQQRASAVTAYLQRKGVASDHLAVVAMGKRNLLPDVAPTDARNRRVEIVPAQ